MDMKIINVEKKLCHCCMENHDVKTITIKETNLFKGDVVTYDAEYYYCDKTDELITDETMLSTNDMSMKDAYRLNKGLLTSYEIAAIRKRYGISQSDLCLLLGWGAKTITRYESHQVQDIAHDTILRKLDEDPEWFLNLLENSKEQISSTTYKKYLQRASQLYESNHDLYLQRTIKSRYACFNENILVSGNIKLSLEKVIDVICYFSNSAKVKGLYKVKLMKMLWFADALSFKRRNQSITGLVYQALPMGAVPIAHESIIDFSRINYEEVDFGEVTGYHFLPTCEKNYSSLSEEEITVLNAIIEEFGSDSKEEIVNKMHREIAYKETNLWEIIQFKYAKELSFS